MKQFLSLVLLAGVILSLAACGADSTGRVDEPADFSSAVTIEEPAPSKPDEPEYIENIPVYEYDALQTIFVKISADTTIEQLWAFISENDLSVTVQEYNKSGGGGNKVIVQIAYTDGAARQKYGDSGDYLRVSFDEIGSHYMSNDNRVMSAEYVCSAGLTALFYNYGTWYSFSDSMDGDYSGYYLVNPLSKDDGITIQYTNGNKATTNYFLCDSADEVIQQIIDSVKK